MRRAVPLAVVLVLAGCGGSGTKAPPATTTSSTASSGGCANVAAPPPRTPPRRRAPRTTLDPVKPWTLTFATSCGTFTVRLAARTSPHAVASLVALARAGYFDRTVFHRIVPGFVIQGGDPTQSGSGGPGYTTVDTPAHSTRYTKGVVAMAKAADEPRGAAGSQFFVMTADAPTLAPDYAVVGRVARGLGVVERIGRLGDPATEQPLRPVVVRTVTVTP